MPERPSPPLLRRLELPLEPEEPTNPRIKLSNYRTRLFVLVASGGFSAISLGGIAYAYDKLETKAKDAGSEAAAVTLAPVAEGLKGHEARLQVLEQTSKLTQVDVHEVRVELRDLYKAQMEGKRSERLETPLPPLAKDGGR